MRRTTKPEKLPKPLQTVEVRDYRPNRPTLYEKNTAERVNGMAKLGLTIAQMAHALGVEFATLTAWLQKHEELRQAYDSGKYIHDMGVELALLDKAMGFEYWEERHVEGIDVNKRPYQYKTRVKKKVLPDTQALMFWLRNRSKERWQDYKDGHTMNILNLSMGKDLDLSVFNAEEIRALRKAAIDTIAGSNAITRD